ALNASGKAKAAPPKKEVVKEPPKPTVSKAKKAEPEPPPKSKKEIEEEQKKLLEEKEEQKQQFFAAEQARKVAASKGADQEVTYVEDRDTRKPKAVSDISDYWKADLGLLPFMPTDNVAETDLPDDVDPSFRLKYLEMLNEKLEKILRLKFHVFWSQVIFDPNVSRLVDSYLRFCLRAHDLEGMEDAGITAEEQAVTKEVSRRMLQLLVRLSRPQESPSDYLSHDKYGQVILESQVLDVPKIIDVCVIYGDANRSTVTKIVHSAFRHQPLFKDDFSSVVQHMLDGLLQCCAPLQFAARGQGLSDQDLSVNECLSFLPDMLSCFNAIFCFFPEDCVDKLLGGSLKVDGATGATAVPLADLMVLLHDAVSALRSKSSDGKTQLDSIIKLLSRLLSCVLGFRMAPRHGANAFGDLVSWLVEHSERPCSGHSPSSGV
ncbi:ASCC2, partial [Symbiodinium sp. KB8]